MKKYPVTYKGTIYEVKWKCDYWGAPYLIVYEIKKILGMRFPVEVYRMLEADVNGYLKHRISLEYTPDYHIEQIKYVFEMMKSDNEKKLAKQEQKQRLKEWDGIIETEV